MPDNSVDSVVTDPPYALVSIVKRFANSPRSERTENTENPYGRTGRGFMGQRWDTGATAHAVEFWAEVLRVLKPGGHLVAFAGTRTYHRLAVAVEDAGFEIRDMVSWAYGSGFPKSHNVSKGIDRELGAERRVVAQGKPVRRMILGADQNKGGWEKTNGREFVPTETAAGSAEAAEWEGWGTALKPAVEPICLARKPLSEKTVAANVLKWGTGAINIDGCRVGDFGGTRKANPDPDSKTVNAFGNGLNGGGVAPIDAGRFPANVVHDGSAEILDAFPDLHGAGQDLGAGGAREMGRFGDAGNAARFFYTAKADAHDRAGSKHPTVKPVDLMQWLVRLVTPKGGLVLDPFAGTGTTAEAAFREGMRCALVEREAEYQDCIRRRMRLVLSGPDERRRESIKAKTKDQPIDPGPLFDTIG